jgi:hypothetical protein
MLYNIEGDLGMTIENNDFVICRICGKQMGCISPPHLKFKHNINMFDYCNTFPDAIMCASNIIKERNKKLIGRECTWAKKISTSNKISWQKNPNQGRTGHSLSRESKQRLSKKLKGHSVSQETREKIGLSGLGKEPWNKGLNKEQDTRLQMVSEKISQLNKNMPQEKRDKISKTLKQRYLGGMKIPNAKIGYRKDLNMSFRSIWEANYARYLLYLKQEIIYEKDRFPLMDNGETKHVYIPDFKVGDNKYIEIKGHANSSDLWKCNCKRCVRDKNKMKLLKEQYPNIVVKIFGKKEYIELCKQYEYTIPNWEKTGISNLLFRKVRKVNRFIRLSIVTFWKASCYFDNMGFDLEELIEVGNTIKDHLENVFDIGNILVKNGWEYEYNCDEVVFYKDDINSMKQEEVKNYLKSIGIDSDIVNIDIVEDFERPLERRKLAKIAE